LQSGSLGLSSIGDWFYNVALVVYVFDRTHSGVWVAAASFARLAPHALGPIAGGLADRSDRIRLMVRSDVARALLMFVLAAMVFLSFPPAAVLVIAALSTAAGTVYVPCLTALTPLVVADDELSSANAALSAIDSLSLVIGPALGAVVLVVSTPALAIAVDGLTFVGSALLLRRAGRLAITMPTRAGAWRITEGVRALIGSPDRFGLSAFDVAHGFLYGLESVLLVIAADRLLGIGVQGVGWLFAAIGLGGVVAAGSTRWLPNMNMAAVLTGSLLLVGAAMASLAFLHDPALACLVMVGDGVGTLFIDVIVTTGLQQSLPAPVMAGAFGALEATTVLAILAGTAVAPVLLAAVGLRWAIVLAGTVVPLATGVIVPVLLPANRAGVWTTRSTGSARVRSGMTAICEPRL
jgi:predicted MFS family arabinose efflux permease